MPPAGAVGIIPLISRAEVGTPRYLDAVPADWLGRIHWQRSTSLPTLLNWKADGPLLASPAAEACWQDRTMRVTWLDLGTQAATIVRIIAGSGL
jgi:hypothetical protein